MTLKAPSVSLSLSLAAMFALSLSVPAFCETKSPEDAQALLQDVKKRDLERQIASKETELNRLKEDLTRQRKESEDLKRSIEGMGVAITETTTDLDQLSAERTRLTQALEVATLRIDAEKLKLAGLKMLSDAQSKVLARLTNHIEGTELKSTIGDLELKLVAGRERPSSEEPILDNANAGVADNTSKLKAQISDLKKKSAKSDRATSEAGTIAGEAMLAASAKLASADAAATKANKKADELGLAEVAEGPAEKDPITGPKAIPVAKP